MINKPNNSVSHGNEKEKNTRDSSFQDIEECASNFQTNIYFTYYPNNEMKLITETKDAILYYFLID